MKKLSIVVAVILAAFAATSFAQTYTFKDGSTTSIVETPAAGFVVITAAGTDIPTELEARAASFGAPSPTASITRPWRPGRPEVYDKAFNVLAGTWCVGRSMHNRWLSYEFREDRRFYLMSSRTGAIVEVNYEQPNSINVRCPEEQIYLYPAPPIWLNWRSIDLSRDEINLLKRFRGKDLFLRRESQHLNLSMNGMSFEPIYPIVVKYDRPMLDLIKATNFDEVDPYIYQFEYVEPHPNGDDLRDITFVAGDYADVLARMITKGYRPATLEDLLSYSEQQDEPMGEVWATGATYVVPGTTQKLQARAIYGGDGISSIELAPPNYSAYPYFAFVKATIIWVGGKG